jgi:hypothetical protein
VGAGLAPMPRRIRYCDASAGRVCDIVLQVWGLVIRVYDMRLWVHDLRLRDYT